jgi:hypothetical protein
MKYKCPRVRQMPLKAISLWQIPAIAIWHFEIGQMLKSQCQMTCTITEVVLKPYVSYVPGLHFQNKCQRPNSRS